MAEGNRKEPLLPFITEKRWNIVTLGRWIGIVVVVAALVINVHESFWATREVVELTFQRKLAFFGGGFIATGSLGVIIYLLAEIIARLTWSDDAEEAANSGSQDGTT